MKNQEEEVSHLVKDVFQQEIGKYPQFRPQIVQFSEDSEHEFSEYRNDFTPNPNRSLEAEKITFNP
jgi:hypothetical protein